MQRFLRRKELTSRVYAPGVGMGGGCEREVMDKRGEKNFGHR